MACCLSFFSFEAEINNTMLLSVYFVASRYSSSTKSSKAFKNANLRKAEPERQWRRRNRKNQSISGFAKRKAPSVCFKFLYICQLSLNLKLVLADLVIISAGSRNEI